MTNNWGIPLWLEKEVRERDKKCVYCGVEFTVAKEERKTSASWEHIINDVNIITRENIVLCCVSCNASKGQKTLSEWLESNFCKNKGISPKTVAPIVKQALAKEL